MEHYKLGKLKISMPTGWHEVPFKTGVELLEHPDKTQTAVISLLSGVDEMTIRKSADFETIYYFATAFMFLERMPRNLENPEMPRSMVFKNDRIIFPYVLYNDEFDLGKAQVGQIEDMLSIIRNMSKEFLGELEHDEEPRPITEIEQLKMIPYIVAIYLQGLIDKEYDHAKAMKLVKDVENAPFKEVVNIGYFFFSKLIGLVDGSKNVQPAPSSIRRKLRLVYSNLMQRLVSLLP